MRKRRIVARHVCMLLVVCIIFGFFLPLQPIVSQAATTDYSKYSNTKKEWFVVRNKKHQAPQGADTAKTLAKYNAYYYDAKATATDKVIYFAFDCGYENGYTEKILDALKAYDAKAVFFVTEHYVRANPKLCKRMKEEGHLVGSHTMKHQSMPTLSTARVKEELTGLERLFKEKTGYTLDKYLRPPMGEYSNRVLKVAKDLGYTTIFWSVVYYDYDPAKQPGTQYVIDHFKTYSHNGAITLTHNISKSNADALKTVLKNLKKDGYRFARIDELGQPKNQKVAMPEWDEKLSGTDTVTSGYALLKWQADLSKKKRLPPDGFEIYRREKGGKYELIATKKANQKNSYVYKDKDVEPGKTYFYKIRSYCCKYGRTLVSERTKAYKYRKYRIEEKD